jgi:antirestriction protein ArdC
MASFGSSNYSKEELVAEMTAAMLCGVTGITQETIENSAAYLRGWLKKTQKG